MPSSNSKRRLPPAIVVPASARAPFSERKVTGSLACPNIPESQGVYVVVLSQEFVAYVGSSRNLRRRIAYLLSNVADKNGRALHKASARLLAYQQLGGPARIDYILAKDYQAEEKRLLAKYDPPWNSK